MNLRRTFIPIGLAALFAAGAVAAMVAAQPPARAQEARQSVAGWEIDGAGGVLTMSRQIGDDRIEYTITGGSHAAPTSERFRLEIRTDRGSCAAEERASALYLPPAERSGELRAQLAARLAEMDPTCVLRPAQNAALIEGFEAAYAIFAARFERVRAAFDRNPDPQTEDLAWMDSDANVTVDMNVEADPALDMDMNTDAGADAAANAAASAAEAAADAAEAAAAAAEAAPPKPPKTGAR